jgi:hypothetical protein
MLAGQRVKWALAGGVASNGRYLRLMPLQMLCRRTGRFRKAALAGVSGRWHERMLLLLLLLHVRLL